MYAGPSKRAASKALCPSCRFLAAFRPLSTSSTLAAKRDRTPIYIKRARTKIPGSLNDIAETIKANPHARDTRPYYISPELAAGLQQLGFYSVPAVVDVLRTLCLQAAKFTPSQAVAALSTQQRFVDIMEVALGSAEVAVMRDPNILRKALHLLGQNFFHSRNALPRQGYEILRMVFLAGELDAGVDAAAAMLLIMKYARRDGRAVDTDAVYSSRIFEFIKAKALAGTDWCATTMYLGEMSLLEQSTASKRDCYRLAKDFYDTVEPSRKLSVENPWLLQVYMSPWQTFYDAARAYRNDLGEGEERDNVQADMERALRDGLYKYTDPGAVTPALHHPEVIRTHSKQWVEFATQAATAGDADAAFALAKYYLSTDGWYPASSSKKPKKWTGVEWLGVSAALSSPDTTRMVYVYGALAHLLREHGYLAEGRSWLTYAKENIGEAGLDIDAAEKSIVDMEQAWKRVEDGDEKMEKHVKSSEYYLTELDKATSL